MIKILAGGKPNANWTADAISEYEKRLRKPYDISWQFMSENKLSNYLEKWPFSGNDFVILLDERGANVTSPELSKKLETAFGSAKSVTIIIGGAFGVSDSVQRNADFILSFSKLVFPHQLARVMITEQIYRAQEISRGGKYHHV